MSAFNNKFRLNQENRYKGLAFLFVYQWMEFTRYSNFLFNFKTYKFFSIYVQIQRVAINNYNLQNANIKTHTVYMQ